MLYVKLGDFTNFPLRVNLSHHLPFAMPTYIIKFEQRQSKLNDGHSIKK